MSKAINFTVLAIIAVLAVVILMTAAVPLLAAMNNSGLSPTDRCEDSGCFYNASRTIDCTATNTTPTDTGTCTEVGSTMPLSSMFASDGVMPLVFGAVVIILSILGMIMIVRKKGGK